MGKEINRNIDGLFTLQIANSGGKSALVVEGGGLRGAYAVGVLRSLYDFGGPEQFDAIYAVSSGVFAATYFAAGQVSEMESTWRDLVHGSLLVNYSNILRGKSVLRLDYLIDLFKGPVKLDLERVFKSRPSIIYNLTNFQTGAPSYFDAKRADIFDLMRASSALPCVYRNPIYIDGDRYIDGGISDPIPVFKAIKDGFSDIVVILTRPRGYEKSRQSYLVANLCLRGSTAARNAFLNAHKMYNKSLRIIESPPSGIRIVAIRPNHLRIHRLTRDRETIIATIEQGKSDAQILFRDILNLKGKALM